MQVLSIGEVLWDVFSGVELLGGAPLNFSANLARLGNKVSLVTAVGEDLRGERAVEGARALGVGTEFIHMTRDAATGVALVSTTSCGEPRFEIPRPAAFDFVSLSTNEIESAMHLRPDWMYFGTLLQTEGEAERLTHQLTEVLSGVRCFYDMNLRPGCWNLALIQRLCRLATVLKLNESEAQTLGALTGLVAESFSLEEFCEQWSVRYELECVCVTLGAAGCMVYKDGVAHTFPGYPTVVQDTVGAGDAFAAAFLHGHHRRWSIPRTARFANGLGALVASRAGATPEWSLEEVLQLAETSIEQFQSVGLD